MNTKSSWVMLALVLLAVLFVPLIPDESVGECKKVPDDQGGMMEDCDDTAGYMSLFQKLSK